MSHVVAVDVGTASARAGVFDPAGTMLARAEHPILINQSGPGRAEHDSEDIWSAVRHVVKAALAKSRIDAGQVAAIGFDATCSLVIRGVEGGQISVSDSGEPRWDTISWSDHRALEEARECTATNHMVLRYAGGVMSPEMQAPKLMWLKRHKPESWRRTGRAFDLADFLTWRASGSDARSRCTLACKWTYLPDAGGWQPDFLEEVGLADMLERCGLPATATAIGEGVGRLSAKAAAELGLTTSCAVSTGLIDAYAGMLGVIGAHAGSPGQLALVAGTSSCVMAQLEASTFIPSFWGPYAGVGLPDLWAVEGGQSATGALLDHIIATHSAGGVPSSDRHQAIAMRIKALLAVDPDFGAELNVLPDFNGNRSPLGAPEALGVISGLKLDASFDGLCKLYWRACVSIALGVRHILEHMRASGAAVDGLHIAGGHARNPLLMQLYADACGTPVIESEAEDAVLLGCAMAAAASALPEASLAETCQAMRRPERRRQTDAAASARLEKDYAAFLLMHRQQQELRNLRVG